MDLRTRLQGLSILRTRDFPPYFRNICLISFAALLPRISALMDSRPQTRLQHVVAPDYQPDLGTKFHYMQNGREASVPISGLDALLDMPHLEKVYMFPPEDPFGNGLAAISRALAPYGLRHFSLHLAQELPAIGAQHDPYFYQKFAPVLQDMYETLADEASRETYAARIKAIITGEPGYLPISAHEEYYHPLVRPEAGDVLIDGGVSDMVGVQQRFAESVGPEGAVHGFEPIPYMFAAAKEKLAAWPQYHLHCQGLGRRQETAYFDDLRDSSRISRENATGGTLACAMTDIDSFVRDLNLHKVDCIKLDVEGSELDALQGARKTIQTHKPKLIVCLYHQTLDLVRIPAVIRSMAPEYEIRIAHSSFHFIDTILYARVRR